MNGFNNLNNLNTLNYSPSRYNDVIYRTEASASLDLNFARNKSLIDSISGNNLVTFTRASSGTFVDSAGVIQTAATDVPRFDHNPTTGESLGLLVEEQRTNLILNSNALSGGWSSDGLATFIQNATVSPDGTLNASQLSPVTNAYRYANATTVVSTVYSWSMYFKLYAGGNNTVRLNAAGVGATFDLSTTAITSSTAISSSITAVGNGWYRCGIVFTATSVFTVPDFVLNGTFGINQGHFIWGAQVEAGAFPTSYIRTTTVSVTRSADVASITGTNFSSWYNQSEGALYTQSKKNYIGASSFPRIFQISDTTNNNSISNIWLEPSNTLGLVVRDSANLQAEIGSPGLTQNIEHKSGMCYKLNDIAISNNGNAVTTDTSAIIPTVDRMFIGKDDGNLYLNGTIKRISYFPTRLSNAILENITK